MTERLSDERLRELAGDDVSAMTAPWPEMRAMAAEIIELRGRVAELDAGLVDAVSEALSLRIEMADHETSFDLRHAADMRALARWRAANPGNYLVMPDHADMVVWLLGQLAAGQVMPELRWDGERNFLFLANLFVGYVGCVDDDYWCGYVASDDIGGADNVIDGAISQAEARAAVEVAVRKALGCPSASDELPTAEAIPTTANAAGGVVFEEQAEIEP